MTLYDYIQRKTPEYYPTIHLDGYTPEKIIAAKHNQVFQQQEPEGTIEIIFKSEVKRK